MFMIYDSRFKIAFAFAFGYMKDRPTTTPIASNKENK